MLSQTQQGLLVLLKEIDDICSRHHIDYYLAGGGMIGAVRHAGFLPWDDDADIHMTKEGAEKFISLSKEFLPGRIVVNKNTHQDYSAVHWRYMNTNHTTMLRSSFITEVPQGQFVDIFILNPITNDETQHEEILRKYYLYSEWVVNHFSASTIREDSLFDGYTRLREREKKEGFEKVRKELEKELFEFPEEKSDYYLIRSPLAGKPIMKKSLWGKPKRIPFEDCMMPVAEKAEEVLMLTYGDRWVDIPDMTDQISHVFVSDQEVPFDLYDREVKQFIDKKEALAFAYRKKDIWFSHAKDRNLANARGREVTRFMIQEKLLRRLEKVDLESLVKEKDYLKLRCIFKPYYHAQFVDFKYYGLYFDMPDQWLYAALLPLMIQGEYSRVRKVLEQGDIPEKNAEKRLGDMYEFCCDATTITNDLYVYRNYSEAMELVQKWLPVFPDCITLLRANIFLQLQEADADLQVIRQKIIESLKLYKEDGELLKYLGDTYRMQGDCKNTCRFYQRANGTIANGLLQTEMKKYLEANSNA